MSIAPQCDCGGAATQVHLPSCPIQLDLLRRTGKGAVADKIQAAKDAAADA